MAPTNRPRYWLSESEKQVKRGKKSCLVSIFCDDVCVSKVCKNGVYFSWKKKTVAFCNENLLSGHNLTLKIFLLKVETVGP